MMSPVCEAETKDMTHFLVIFPVCVCEAETENFTHFSMMFPACEAEEKIPREITGNFLFNEQNIKKKKRKFM